MWIFDLQTPNPSHLLLILCLLNTILPIFPEEMGALSKEFAAKQAEFTIKFYNTLNHDGKNIVFSPFSIQTAATMIRMGATGKTAEELDKGLGLIENDPDATALMFNNILKGYENSPILKIANKVYVMEGFTIKNAFKKLVLNQLYSSVENIDFAQNVAAANEINSWVEDKTNYLIKNLVPADVLDSSTRMVLINAIHFKGEWVHKFRKHATHDDDFYLNDSDTVKVPMMSQKERFRYGEFPDLDATALEMPYKDTDLSMLIILPNSKTGLKALESKLLNVNLSQITEKMDYEQVVVKLPRFKSEFSAELTESFQKLGMSRLFSSNAEFSNLLEEDSNIKVSKIIHKAFIEVNEEGTEAAAATAGVVRMKRSIVSLVDPKEFTADHPYIYFINCKSSIENSEISYPLFMGTVLSLESVSVSETHDEL